MKTLPANFYLTLQPGKIVLASPLTCPVGATSIDTTHVSLDQVVEQMSAAVAAKLHAA